MPYTRLGMSNNVGAYNSVSYQEAINMRFYKSTDDTLSQLLGAAYFNAALEDFEINIGDVWIVVGSDLDAEIVKINALLPDLVIQSFIGTPSIVDGSITTPKLADLAVTTPKLANGSVTEDKLSADSVSGSKSKDYTLGGDDPYVPIAHDIVVAAGPGGNFDKTFANTGMVIEYAIIKWISAGTVGDTVQLFNDLGAPITEVFDTQKPINSVLPFAIINVLNGDVATGGYIRATAVDGGGGDSPELLITLYGYPKP